MNSLLAKNPLSVRGEAKMDAHDEPGYLSDESEFYGIVTLLITPDKANQLFR